MFTRFSLSDMVDTATVTFHQYQDGIKTVRILRIAPDENSWFDFNVTDQQTKMLAKCLKQFGYTGDSSSDNIGTTRAR